MNLFLQAPMAMGCMEEQALQMGSSRDYVSRFAALNYVHASVPPVFQHLNGRYLLNLLCSLHFFDDDCPCVATAQRLRKFSLKDESLQSFALKDSRAMPE